MPQELRVVQCFQCEMFQVDMVKKVNKWQCKVCNTKQSLRKEIFRGSGAECRNRVQECNRQKAECVSQESNTILELLNEGDDFIVDAIPEIEDSKLSEPSYSRKRVNTANKWDDLVKVTEVHVNHSKHTSFNSEKELNNIAKRSKWDKFL